ncbi:MAG: hypothetical protein ACRD0K_22570 [Egibacteraceae bacterium]
MYAFDQPLIPGPRSDPDIKIDGRDFEAFLPMLTTDFFEFGTSKNELWKVGGGVERGDAVLGMVTLGLRDVGLPAPRWLVIRNASDPQINGDLPDSPRALNMQAHWAVWYYETYGYWTSVNSAIATWAMTADDCFLPPFGRHRRIPRRRPSAVLFRGGCVAGCGVRVWRQGVGHDVDHAVGIAVHSPGWDALDGRKAGAAQAVAAVEPEPQVAVWAVHSVGATVQHDADLVFWETQDEIAGVAVTRDVVFEGH